MVRKVVVSLLLACLVGYALIAFTANHSYVSTPSMYPTIPPGSEIFISSTKTPRVGEVIVFRANGLTWAHRLIQIKPDGSYVTKGDNPANSPDVFVPAVTNKDVVGVVTHAPRWLGFPELIAHQPGYGLSWLRAELDLPDKAALIAVIGLLSYAFAGDKPRIGRHRSKGGQERPRRTRRIKGGIEAHGTIGRPPTVAAPTMSKRPEVEVLRRVAVPPQTTSTVGMVGERAS